MSTLRIDLRSGRVTRVRRDAIRLKRDAEVFAQDSGRIGNRVHAYSKIADAVPVRTYLTLVSASLTADWYEGKALARLADIIWRDPLGLTPATEEKLASTQKSAERFATTAVTQTARARNLRARYRRLFRYVPVKTRANGR
jgi:hypothetical protein